MRQVNTTFMTKLGSTLLTEKDKSWFLVFHAKCNGRCNTGMFKSNQTSLALGQGFLKMWITLAMAQDLKWEMAIAPYSGIKIGC